MTASIREPFFLRGRTSVLQRAVLMSLVLALQTSVAAWIVLAAVWLEIPVIAVRGIPKVVAYPVAMIATTLIVHGPLNYWRRRSWYRTFVAIPLMVPMAVPLLVVASAEAPLSPSSVLYRSPVAILLLVLMLIIPVALQGLPLQSDEFCEFRTWRNSILASAFTGLSLLFVIDSVPPEKLYPHTTTGLFARAGLIHCWLFAVFVPWGTAFWRPQEPEAALVEPPPSPPRVRTPVPAFVAAKRLLIRFRRDRH